MKNENKYKEIRAKGLLWARKEGCEMYVVVGIGEYIWYMFSEKTGIHSLKNKGKYGRPVPCERVLAHWNGFIQNQKR